MPAHPSTDGSDETKPAAGFGPNAGGTFSQEDYHHPAAGWGAAISVTKVLIKQHELLDGTRVVFKMNHENGGYDCPGCAWPDDRKGLRLDICENGIKHATWEMPPRQPSTPRAVSATKRHFFTSFSLVSWERTICRIARTCAMRRAGARSPRPLAPERAPWIWWIGKRRTASSSWGSTRRRTPRGCLRLSLRLTVAVPRLCTSTRSSRRPLETPSFRMRYPA